VSKKILIEATHSEETRVAVVEGSNLIDFDHENSDKTTIKGNIYLAKIVRVEPSLQAAFVDYGGNRHGFLAFDEIHPDYFRIPVEDREILEELRREEFKENQDLEMVDEVSPEEIAEQPEGMLEEDSISEEFEEEKPVEGGDKPKSIAEFIRRYKIQEVIKSRQIVLVQAVKEERGNKGAAMTTYISLAGRYCVLMPNTSTAGGVSRRINKVSDRKRLKKILTSFDVAQGMSLIIRTAGMDRNKTELKRDYKYLLTLWGEIREKTLKAVAPDLVYTEADLIQRTLRDLYTREVEQVLVEGEDAYRHAKNIMRKVLPSHAKRVQKYTDEECPLFFKYGVEKQINQIFQSQVPLKSGGYLVIHQTEALVSIDVNSGRATKERHIESTAFNTNLEAARETGRQLKLRDLAGLVVIDFIDMSDYKQNQAVEKALRESMSDDRARVQIGRISQFGLLELSRQRIRPSLHERSGIPCERCLGTGFVRSAESIALQLLRLVEEECVLNKREALTVLLPTDVGFFILNHKKGYLQRIQDKSDTVISLEASSKLGNGFEIRDAEGHVLFTTSLDVLETNATEKSYKPHARSEHQNRKQKKNKEGAKDKKIEESNERPAIDSEQETNNVGQGEKKETESKQGRKKTRRGGRYRGGKANRKNETSRTSDSVPEETSVVSANKVPQKKGPHLPSGKDEKEGVTPEKKGSLKKSSAKKGWWKKLLDPEV
jgi:ribonuclease E